MAKEAIGQGSEGYYVRTAGIEFVHAGTPSTAKMTCLTFDIIFDQIFGGADKHHCGIRKRDFRRRFWCQRYKTRGSSGRQLPSWTRRRKDRRYMNCWTRSPMAACPDLESGRTRGNGRDVRGRPRSGERGNQDGRRCCRAEESPQQSPAWQRAGKAKDQR